MKEDLQKIIEQFTDYLLPILTPYEAGLYIFLLRNSFIKNGSREIRIGKRTIADNLGASRGEKTNYAHVTKLVNGLEEKSCIKIGDTTREGTLYSVFLPEEIPSVKEKLSIVADATEEDYFTDPEKRKEIFKRDKYICHYCGEKVTPENATLDHLTPQCKGEGHTKENLKTSCLVCNSIKSGKTYEEAAPYLLKSIQERKVRNNNH
ncbi:MAG: HNH endonuclease signature motif containing protein [Candidatus Pacebacteria bacterium]|nr:HNH endonuclease signature motif containing protein [Candidatus Paceibacterota bacterium]